MRSRSKAAFSNSRLFCRKWGKNHSSLQWCYNRENPLSPRGQKVKRDSFVFISLLVLFILLLSGGCFKEQPPVTEQWVQTYKGSANLLDIADAIAVDAAGNVYVTGSSVDSSTDCDSATIKYNSAGIQQWAQRYNGPANGVDNAYAMAVDNTGNVYVTGKSEDLGKDSDYVTIKYDGNGNQLWVARYKGPGDSFDWAMAIAIDGDGNVYITGRSKDDYATVKYDCAGNQLWVARYNGPDNSFDWANAIAVDKAGNVYVTGSSLRNVPVSDYATIKYDGDGNQLWVARSNELGSGINTGRAIAVDVAGNVYVTGDIGKGPGTSADYATIKYSSDGNQLWAAKYNGPDNGNDYALSIAIDTAGNVYVTGASGKSAGDSDYATVKYNSDGKQLWVARYKGSVISNDWANAIALDIAGNVYITGSSQSDCVTIKYDSDGNQLWIVRYAGPDNSYDWVNAIALDATGNVYITGESGEGNKDVDYLTVKYSQPQAIGRLLVLIVSAVLLLVLIVVLIVAFRSRA
jgi:uncharacterized delta-60 repeat protein